MFELITHSAVLISIYATGWFIVSLIVKRNDIADIAWGLGHIALTIFYFFTTPNFSRTVLLYVLVIVWGVRLTIHIYMRNKGKKEDFRYKQWREQWGKLFFIRSFLQVYILQAMLLLCIIFPLIVASSYPQYELHIFDMFGVVIWGIGFFFETVGDYQLLKFKQNPKNKGKILQHGLWKYTRHPNYFGEVTMWWGIFCIALSSPYGILAVISPITITVLILFVSGIPMLEKKYKGNKAFEAYKKRTSVFFPLPPKKS